MTDEGAETEDPFAGIDSNPSASPSGSRWLILATFSLLLSLVLLPVSSVWLHLVGYLTAIVLTFGCVVVFRRRAQRREMLDGIALATGVRRYTIVLIVSALLLAGVHAYLSAPDIVRAIRDMRSGS